MWEAREDFSTVKGESPSAPAKNDARKERKKKGRPKPPSSQALNLSAYSVMLTPTPAPPANAPCAFANVGVGWW